MSQEVTYYSDGVIQVTNARAVLEGKTYAMSNITSVTMGKIPANPWIGILMAVAGLLMLLFSFSVLPEDVGERGACLFFALLVVVLGVALAYFAKAKYVVKIGSASGEADALTSTDKDYIQKIVNAINEAIIKRG